VKIRNNLWGVGRSPPADLGPPEDPNRDKILALLTKRPRTPRRLRKVTLDYKAVIEALRAEGKVIKSVKFPGGLRPWVYCLSKGGRLCGVEGKKGEDPDTARGPRKKT